MQHADLNSPNLTVRAIERWKRGMATLALSLIAILAAMIPAAAIGWLASLAGANEFIVGSLTLVVIAPWMIGNREWLNVIGRLASAPNQ